MITQITKNRQKKLFKNIIYRNFKNTIKYNIMLDFTQIKLGAVVIYNNKPSVIISCDFLRMQASKPTKRCKIKNLITGNTVEYNFKSGESVEEADLKKIKANFLYSSGEEFSFMTADTYETIEVDKSLLGGKEGYLKEGGDVIIVFFNDSPIIVEMPIKVTLKVIRTVEAARGNTVSDVYKEATLETGLEVKVPGFIKEGENIIFNTVEDEYGGREGK